MQSMKAKTQDLIPPHWDDVRIFLAVQRSGSLGKAKNRLGVDVSTVSRRLAALEARLGSPLFERRREGLLPTAAAEAVLPAAEAMESAAGMFARSASGIETAAEGVVRISGPPGLVDAFVAPALVRLRARHPGIRVEIDASTRVLDLTKHEADLALRSVRPEGARLVVTKLATSAWVCVASKALAAKLGVVASWDALTWIGWDHDLASLAPARWLMKHVPRAEVALRTSHFASQLAACRTGLGVLLVPAPYLQVHPLVPVRFTERLAASAADWPVDALWLVAARASRHLPRVHATWEFLIEELRPGEPAAEPRDVVRARRRRVEGA